MSATSVDGLSPLAVDLRAQDPDRYLSTLFVSSDHRRALFALYAFDHEIAKVRRVVREPMAGLIRFQWWRDALEAIGKGNVLAHPVVQGLSGAITEQDLDRDLLLTAIDAREREWEGTSPEDWEAFEAHLCAANGSIVKAAVLLFGQCRPEILAAADQVGMSLGLLERLTWLTADPAAHHPLLSLPRSLLLEHGLTEGDLDDEGQHQVAKRIKIDPVKQALLARAKHHLGMARQQRSLISRHLLPIFFPGTLAGIRLGNLDRSREHPALATAPYRLLWHWLRGSF